MSDPVRSDTGVGAQLVAEEALLSRSAHSGLYHDRIRSPAATVSYLRPALPTLGITRLASVTNLDRIGIPVFIAVRPNARTLAVTQGKGIDEHAARASALMEAAEQAIAETPLAPLRHASADELAASGEVFVPLARFLRHGRPLPAAGAPLAWLRGYDLLTGQTVWAPRDAVRLDFTVDDSVGHPFWQSSDGLAAGNILLEGVLHGLCERIERDASSLWSFRTKEQILARCIDPGVFGDPVLNRLAAQIAAAGLRMRLFDITSDVGVPVFFAVIAEPAPTGPSWRHFDLSRGTGCHPFAVRAAIRAITEAAQSRLTGISGARDDFSPTLYDAPLKADLHIFRLAEPRPTSPRLASLNPAPRDLLHMILDRLRKRGVRSVVVVPLGGEELGFSVAKVIVPDLEDPPESRHRRFGRRAISAMLEAA